MKNRPLLFSYTFVLFIIFSFSSIAQNDIAFEQLWIENMAQINGNTEPDGFYSHRPLNHIIPIMFAGDVKNVGTFNQTDVYFYATVNDSMNNTVYYDSAYAALLNTGDTTYLECPNYFTPAGNNNFTVVMNCQQAEIDANPIDNVSESINFSISDERKMKRYNDYNDNFSPAQYGGGNESTVGVTFTLAVSDTIESIDVFIDSTTTGGLIIGKLYMLLNNGDAIEILTTEEINVQQTIAGYWATLLFIPEGSGEEVLDPHYRYLISLELYPMAYSIGIGTDTTGYHNYLVETQYTIHSGTASFVQYLEEIPLIEINLSQPSANINISEVETDIKLELFPNPANNTLNISSTREIETIEIYNQTGQIVETIHELSLLENPCSIDISNLPVGSYFIRAVSKDNHRLRRDKVVWAEKFVVVR